MSMISLATAKEFLRITYTTQDTILQILIDGVENFVTRRTGLYLTASDVTENLEGGGFALRPNRIPLNSVTSVRDNESGSTYASDDYHVKNNGIFLDSDLRWERSRAAQWCVVYNGGYSSYDVVPAGLKLIALQLLARAYENRGSKSNQGAAGYGANWDRLVDSDMLKELDSYRRGRMIVG